MIRLRADAAPLPAVRVLLVFAAIGTPGDARIEAAPLRAGVAAESILRDNPSRPVHDPLYAKALVIGDGTTKVAIVSLDVGGASADLVAAVSARLREEPGIADVGILLNASHNHHTQGQVADDVAQRIVRAVRRASRGMVPVKVGAGTGREDRIAMNRRLRLNNGKHWTIRRANPSPPDHDVAELGPVDPEIGVLRLDTATGRPLAVVYHYAVHPYGGVPCGGVTADLPGFASAVLEKALGNGAKALFLQGFAGDVTPIRYKDVDAPPPTERLGTRLGLSALDAFQRIATLDEAPLRLIAETVELPRRNDVEARIESLERQQEEILQFFTGIGCGTHGAGTFLNFKSFLPLYLKHRLDAEHPAYAAYLYEHEAATGQRGLEELDDQNRQRVEKYLKCIEQMERLIRIRSNLEAYQRHRDREQSDPIAAEIVGLRVGDFALVTFPGEPFAEIALRIKRQSPLEHTLAAGYTNGHLGYAPTADAYDQEAYEDALTPFAPEWQAIYEQKALEILGRLAAP